MRNAQLMFSLEKVIKCGKSKSWQRKGTNHNVLQNTQVVPTTEESHIQALALEWEHSVREITGQSRLPEMWIWSGTGHVLLNYTCSSWPLLWKTYSKEYTNHFPKKGRREGGRKGGKEREIERERSNLKILSQAGHIGFSTGTLGSAASYGDNRRELGLGKCLVWNCEHHC